MRFDLNSQPDDIVIEPFKDGNVIKLKHVHLTAAERLRAMDLLARDIAASMEFLYDKIVGWDGVEDANGKPMPTFRTEDNRKISNVDAVLGKIPLCAQMDVWAQQMMLNGVEFALIQDGIAQLCSEEDFNRLKSIAAELGKPRTTEAKKSSTS